MLALATMTMAFVLGGASIAKADPTAKETVTVRLGQHKDYTRLVFDFTRLVPYKVSHQGTRLRLDFNSAATPALPRTRGAQISGLKQVPADGQMALEATVPAQAKINHYRLDHKIVIDVYAPRASSTPPAQAKTPAAVKTPPPASPPPPPVEPVAATPAPAQASPVETPPPAPTTAQQPPAIVEDTVITLSTVEPAAMAVFSRNNQLWLALDTSTASIPPEVRGGMAAFLGSPRALKFQGGTAYRFTLPPDMNLSVTKRDLGWQVTLSSRPKAGLSRNQMNIDYDEASRKARLMTELKNMGRILHFRDPDAGDEIFAVPVNMPDQRIERPLRTPDLEIIPSALGLALAPRADGIRVTRLGDYVTITSPQGILVTPGTVGLTAVLPTREESDERPARLFDFPNWRQGGIERLLLNKRDIEKAIGAARTPDQKAEAYMKLAVLYFANTFGPEALGALRLAAAENERLLHNPGFLALRGAAAVLAGHYDDAFKDLSHPLLQGQPEISLWEGYAAAATEQWRKASRAFPNDNHLLAEYPESIAVPFTIYMAESALRLGHTETARNLLSTLNASAAGLDSRYRAALNYLAGEAARQEGKFEEAITFWSPVAGGRDRLYHAKASLAKAELLLQEDRITLDEAIDRVENLRFAWRGDGLEVAILHTLGQLKIRRGQYLSGLQDMRTAVVLARGNLEDTTPITHDMARAFYDLYVDGLAHKLPALEAVAIFTDFANLMPAGQDGARATLNFADFLVRIDLLERAAGLLENQVRDRSVPPTELYAVGKRLAAIHLLDGKPAQALSALNRTEIPNPPATERDERLLLRARALSESNQHQQAIAVLNNLYSPAALRLKADIHWRARNWTQAGAALSALLPLDPPPKLDPQTAELVLNAAVAYRLGNNRAGAAEMRQTWGSLMAATPYKDVFNVVTRQSGKTELADRETLLKIASEVDIFKNFLENYKTITGKND